MCDLCFNLPHTYLNTCKQITMIDMLSKEELQRMNNINVYAMFNIENLLVFMSTF